MTLVASQVRVAGTGELFVAASGTAAPADATTALAAAWKGLGYTQEDGATIGRSLERDEVTAWQSVTPVRYIYNGAELTVAAAMLQSNAQVVSMWMEGDFAATATGATQYKANMPTIPTGVERAVLLQWVDDEIVNRLYLPRAELRETGDITISRTSAIAFEMTWGALAPDTGTTLATWITNDAAFAPPA